MTDTALTVDRVSKDYPVTVWGKGIFRETRQLRAVDNVSFSLERGETLGLVGESGCGKTTLARLILRLTPVTEGRILYGNTDVTHYTPRQMRSIRRHVQMVFQDPYASLNPRRTVRELVGAPLEIMDPERYSDRYDGRRSRAERRKAAQAREERSIAMLEEAGLSPSFLEKFPHEMSGGERQRVAIARAMISDPALIICDEPASALDASVRGQILNLLKRFQREKNVACIFISHDLGAVRYLCDRVEVMYLGTIVEQGNRRDIFAHPVHPYTKALLSAEPIPVAGRRSERILLRGEVASMLDPPAGCPFHTRCLYATQGCSRGVYPLRPLERADGDTHSTACPRYHKEIT